MQQDGRGGDPRDTPPEDGESTTFRPRPTSAEGPTAQSADALGGDEVSGDATVLRPRPTREASGRSDGRPINPAAEAGSDDGTVFRPTRTTGDNPATDGGTVFRPGGTPPAAVTSAEDGTVFRPGSPATRTAGPEPDGATVWRPGSRPTGEPSDEQGEGTVLRPGAAPNGPAPGSGQGQPSIQAAIDGSGPEGTVILPGGTRAPGSDPGASNHRPYQGEATVFRAGEILGDHGPGWSPQTATQSTTLRPPRGQEWDGTVVGSPASLPPITQAAEVPTFAAGAPNRRYELPEERWAAPPEVIRKERRKLPVKALVAWVVAVVLLGVIGGVVYVNFLRTPVEDPNTKLPVDGSASAKVTEPWEVVQQYLTALAEGRVNEALSLGPGNQTGSRALLNDRAYAASRKVAPITGIEVPKVEGGTTQIPARYTIGNQKVSTTFAVVKQDDGSWQMAKTTVKFRLQGTNATRIPLLVNGVRINWETPVELLPGKYTVTTGLPFIAFDQRQELFPVNLEYPEMSSQPLTPVLTKEGSRELLNAARQSLDKCVSRRELAPANCPLQVRLENDRVKGGAIKWELAEDPWASARPVLSTTDQAQGQILIDLHARVAVTTEKGGYNGNQPYDKRVIVSSTMTVGNAAQIKPEWRFA